MRKCHRARLTGELGLVSLLDLGSGLDDSLAFKLDDRGVLLRVEEQDESIPRQKTATERTRSPIR